MIKNVIFDFGDIFINLDKDALFKELRCYGFDTLTPKLENLAQDYETGLISSEAFLEELKSHFPTAKKLDLKRAWNSILLDFPDHRLEFLEQLYREGTYRLFLLSNTNEIHIDYVKDTIGMTKYNRFKACFEQFYLSHEIQRRKPNKDIYEYVLQENNLRPTETFFVDDTKANTDAALELGIQCWNLQVGQEEIIDLKARL
jgi:putative hydrolase of the HAD superfamily